MCRTPSSPCCSSPTRSPTRWTRRPGPATARVGSTRSSTTRWPTRSSTGCVTPWAVTSRPRSSTAPGPGHHPALARTGRQRPAGGAGGRRAERGRPRPGRLRLRPHGGRLRPRHRGRRDRRAPRPAAGPRAHGRHRRGLRHRPRRPSRGARRRGPRRGPARPGRASGRRSARRAAVPTFVRRGRPCAGATDGAGGARGDGPLAALEELATRVAVAAGRLVVDERPRLVEASATKSSPTDIVTIMDTRAEELHPRTAARRASRRRVPR